MMASRSPFLALVAVLALSFGAHGYHMPVIQIGLSCQPVCHDFDYTLQTACVTCLYAAGWVPTWSNSSQPAYSFMRIPLVENGGLDYAVAVPLQAPDAPTYAGMLGVAFNARQVYPDLPKNVEICHNGTCITRNMGPDAVVRNPDSPTGFCARNPGWLNLDPSCETLKYDEYQTIAFNTPEQMALGYASGQNGRRCDEYIPQQQMYAGDLMRDVDVAADAIWYMNAVVWSSTMYFKAINQSDMDFLSEQFGDEWTDEMTTMLENGELVMMDLATWMYDLKLNLTSTQMQPGALMIFKRMMNEEGRLVLRCIMLKLFDTGMKRVEPEIYTPMKSETAWLIAMVYARSAVVFHQIRIGHFYTYHVVSSSFHYALYNTIDVGTPAKQSSHPIRQVLDEFTDPLIQNSIQLGTYRGISDPPYVAIKSPYYPQMHNQFVMSGGPLGNEIRINDGWGLTPPALMKRSGLRVEDYTSPGGEPWDQYEQMKIQLDLFNMCVEYGTNIAKTFYKDSNAMKKDQELQDFLHALTDRHGANLISVLEDSDEVKTRGHLGQVLGNVIFKTVIHAMLHLLDFFKKNLNIVAGPTRIDKDFLPDPDAEYTLEEMMVLMPDAFSMAQQLYQGFNIAMVSPQGGPWLYPGSGDIADVDYTAKPPFDGSTKAGARANQYAAEFRQKITEYMTDFPMDPYKYGVGLRQTEIFFNWPWEMTTHIDF